MFHALRGAALFAVAIPALAPFFATRALASHGAAYAFAQQKVYGMTLVATPGSTATLAGDPAGFVVRMGSAATISAFTAGVSFNGGLDTPQAFVGTGSPAQPPENWVGNLPPGFSTPAAERVLLQAVPTAPGVPNGFVTTAPVATDFTLGDNVARADAYATPNPDTAIAPPGSGTPPANVPPGSWPPAGVGVPAGKLFAPIGTPGTLSIDSVAESLLTNRPHDTFATSIADWTVTGGFHVLGDAATRAAVSFDFNLVERLVVYSGGTGLDAATASNRLALDIFDAGGRSVFGPLLGANPSSTRMLTSLTTFSQTYNNATFIPAHLYPGPVVVNFQTLPLAPGRYTFEIKGTTTAEVVAVPEPSATAAIASAVAVVLVRARRRRAAGAPA